MNTKQLKQKILDLAIRGKLVQQDPSDEPAEVLLERIRKEKTQLIKMGKIKKTKKAINVSSGNASNIFDKIPANWTMCRLGELCDIVRGGSPRPAGSDLFYNGNISFMKVADLTNNDTKYVSKCSHSIKEAGLAKTRLIEPGTLLLSNSGATLGVPKISKIQSAINDGIAAFLFLDENLIPYLYFFLESQTKAMRKIDQGATQPKYRHY